MRVKYVTSGTYVPPPLEPYSGYSITQPDQALPLSSIFSAMQSGSPVPRLSASYDHAPNHDSVDLQRLDYRGMTDEQYNGLREQMSAADLANEQAKTVVASESAPGA